MPKLSRSVRKKCVDARECDANVRDCQFAEVMDE